MPSVLLVQPPHRDTFGYSMPPLGPLHLGAVARDAGHPVRFVDLALLVRRGDLPASTPAEADTLSGRAADLLLAEDPDVIGIGSMVSSMPATLDLARELEARRPGLTIILGGQGPETVEERVIDRHPAVDAVAVGEADATFGQWLAALDAHRDPADVPGLVVRRDGRALRTPARAPLADLDAVRSPAWDLAESPRAYRDAAGGDEALFPVDLGRGCSFACSFCTTPAFWGRAARHLSPARAVDELDRLAALDGLDVAYVTHDLFTADRQRVLAICAEKIRRGNTLAWECRTRLDLVDAELLAALRDAGCRRILYGVESDSADVLRLVNKGGRAAAPQRMDVRAQLRMASDVGMASIVGTMAGVPGETAADVEANLQLMAEAAVLDGVSLSMHWFNPMPGNGQATADDALHLEPDGMFTADLVRGFDLPAGHVPAAWRALIEEDAEVFAAFRTSPPSVASAEALYLLSRNAQLVLEVLPRSLRALARADRTTLLELLIDELVAAADQGRADGWPAERFVEPRVFHRDDAVALFARRARAHADPAVRALCDYELQLYRVDEAVTVAFGVDPTPLVAALDADRWPVTPTPGPRTLLFTRDGDCVRAAALSPFLADVAGEDDDEALRRRWPDATSEHMAQARALLAGHTAPIPDPTP